MLREAEYIITSGVNQIGIRLSIGILVFYRVHVIDKVSI